MKLSIDLYINDGVTKELVPEAVLLQVAKGCREGLNRLGSLQEAVKTIRATFEKYDGEMKPSLQIFYEDPLGQETEHRIHFRWYRGDLDKLSADTIADCINETGSMTLKHCIIVHLCRCREKMDDVERKIRDQLSTPESQALGQAY